MAIYTRFGSAIEITAARLVPIWVERTPDEIKWHYSEPKKPRAGSKIEEAPVWHYKGHYVGNVDKLAERLGSKRELVCDGKWVDANSLKADDGWKEIEAKLIELNLDHHLKFQVWNLKDSPEASHFFTPISAKEAA